MPFTSAARQYLTPAPRTSSVLDKRNHFAVFDARESLIAQFWFTEGSDRDRDVARRRAHEFRAMLDKE